MKKIVSILLIALVMPLTAQVANDFPGKPDAEYTFQPTSLQGYWTRAERGKATCYKHYFNGRFSCNRVDPTTGQIIYSAFGYYQEKPSALSEKIRFITKENLNLAGKRFAFILAKAGADVFSQEDKSAKEVWSRVINSAPSKTLQPVADYSDEPTAFDGIWTRTWSGGEKGMIKIYDRGRMFIYIIDVKNLIIYGSMLGIFSVDADGVLREMVQHTSDITRLDEGLHLYRIKDIGKGQKFKQTWTDGRTETWSRW